VERGTAEETYYKDEHLDNNTFSEGEGGGRNWGAEREDGDGGRGIFIEGEEVRVVVVKITNGRVSDWKGAVRDWSLCDDSGNEGLVNGVGNI